VHRGQEDLDDALDRSAPHAAPTNRPDFAHGQRDEEERDRSRAAAARRS
jgi:hypothetical protein